MSTIAQNLQTIATAKANIATSINNKGGRVTSSTPLSAYSAAIDAIPSGGGGGEPDWSEIGYSGAPQFILDGHAYAKNIYDNWDASATDLSGILSGTTQLRYMPLVDTSNATDMNNMFNGCSNLAYIPLMDTSGVGNMSSMFNNCTSLTGVPQFNTSACTQMNRMFNGCTGLTSVPLMDTSNVDNMDSMFANCSGITTVPQFNTSACTRMEYMFQNCASLTSVPFLDTRNVSRFRYMFSVTPKLEKIGGLDFTSGTDFSTFIGNSNKTALRYALFKNLGTPSRMTSYDFTKATNWGVADSTYTDARQSLVDSLLTYSFDRATAGYSTCTIKLSSNSKNLLTAQEISDIEAKGYTIA